MEREYTIKDILRIEVAPALGCTEPAAVALCGAAASSVLPGRSVESVRVALDPHIYKNSLSVAIPGTGGGHGIELAAALGAVCGDPSLGLEVLRPVDEGHLQRAKALVEAGLVAVELLADEEGIHIEVEAEGEGRVARATIEDFHDRITSITLDGVPASDTPLLSGTSGGESASDRLQDFLKERTIEELVEMVADLDDGDRRFIEKGIRYNLELARYGLENASGMAVGTTLERLAAEGLLEKDMMLEARILTAAACDARMAGAELPAMSSAGSGNHGITAVLPVHSAARHLGMEREKRALEAVALSHVITAYIKSHTGRLGALCGCSIAAGAGAAAGIAYLMSTRPDAVGGAVKNLVEDLAGVICDGAKSGCALKLATAAGTAVQAALFATHGITVGESDGIVAASAEQTMRNVGELGSKGMIEADRTILEIMIEKKFGRYGKR